MNVFFVLVPALLLYFVAHRFYGRFLGRVFGEDDARLTPAYEKRDGVDFVPTRPHVLFAHHFCAISAAGPIIGPTFALMYGYVPVLLWIVVGAVLIGAVHDFACLFVSMREGGRSIADIARTTLGKPVYLCFVLFIIFNLVLVNAVFVNLTAVSLTSLQSPEQLGLPADQHIFRTVPTEKGPMAVVGGVASSSAIALTLIAPLLGYLVVRRHMRERFSYPLAAALCIGSVLVGFLLPLNIPPLQIAGVTIGSSQIWVVLIALYTLVAASVPIWLILQPREFVSVQFLYIGIGLLVIALIGAGLRGHGMQAAPADLAGGTAALGSIWPILFVTVACGALSGFHGLVASGTTCKQVQLESHCKHIGYGGMLCESLLALCVTMAVAVGIGHTEYASYLVKPLAASADWRPNPALAFSAGVAGVCELGLGIPRWLGVVFGLLMVEGFVLDTLDVSIRLNRYLFEELWKVIFGRVPAMLSNYWVNSGIAVALMLALAFGNTANALWPIFGSGNQLLGAISLLTLSVWLIARRRRAIHILVPAILVSVTTITALIYLLVNRYLPPPTNVLLSITAIAFIVLALIVIRSAATAALRLRTRLE